MKITCEKTKGGYVLTLFDRNDRPVASNADSTPKKAAIWLARSVNRIATQCEELIIELGFLTEAEIEAAVAEADANQEPLP